MRKAKVEKGGEVGGRDSARDMAHLLRHQSRQRGVLRPRDSQLLWGGSQLSRPGLDQQEGPPLGVASVTSVSNGATSRGSARMHLWRHGEVGEGDSHQWRLQEDGAVTNEVEVEEWGG